jgi:hypothetical protein
LWVMPLVIQAIPIECGIQRQGIHVSRDIIWLNQMYYKTANDPEYVELNVNLMNVQADEEDSEESSSHSTDDDANVEQADKGKVEVDEEEADEENVINDVNEEPEPNVEADNVEEPVVTRTRSGHAVNRPRRFLDELDRVQALLTF